MAATFISISCCVWCSISVSGRASNSTKRIYLSRLICTIRDSCSWSRATEFKAPPCRSFSDVVTFCKLGRNFCERPQSVLVTTSFEFPCRFWRGEWRRGRRAMVAVRDTVQLTELERQIFGILTSTLQYFELRTQLRVAGGWVRDKLLGKDSLDIDIALDNMHGRIFCEKVNEYLSSVGEQTHHVGVIQSNPDQSKHLETAKMKLLGLWVDFVNLRAESYTEGCRIPSMTFGTAEEDAFRRDLTINRFDGFPFFASYASEYVETTEVHDVYSTTSIQAQLRISLGGSSYSCVLCPKVVKRFDMTYDLSVAGISDLRAGVICTPLPPESTFMDDPLRVLRSIRFGARFDFKLDEELKKAAALDCIRAALDRKVTNERIGHEIDLMLSGMQPDKAMAYLEELLLFRTVFSIPEKANPPVPEHYGRSCVAALQAATQVLDRLEGDSQLEAGERRICLLSALLLPLRSYSFFDDKKREIPITTSIIRESLKLGTYDAVLVVGLHDAVEKFRELTQQLASSKDNLQDVPTLRVQAGLLLLKTKVQWRAAVVLSSITNVQGVAIEDGHVDCNEAAVEEKNVVEIAKLCDSVICNVNKMGLARVWESKPVVDGKEIMNLLSLGPGKQVQEWKNRVLHWQLAHPSSTAEECVDWIREENVKRLKSH